MILKDPEGFLGILHGFLGGSVSISRILEDSFGILLIQDDPWWIFFERFSRILPDWTRNPRILLGFPTIFDDPVKIGSKIQGFLRSWTILLRNSQEFFRDPQIFSTIPDDPVGFFKHGSKLQPKSNGFWDPRRPWWIIQAILKTKPTIQGSFCHARRSWGILSGGQGCSTPPERNPKLTLGEHPNKSTTHRSWRIF